MVRSVAASAAAGVAIIVSQGAAWAEPQCSPRQVVIDYLLAEFQEQPVGAGVANNGGVVEVLASPNGATWTILVTRADGVSCMMAAGRDWQVLPLVLAAESQPGV